VTEPASINTPLPWQQQSWLLLQQLMADKRLPHAVLFTGMPGTGKQQFAYAFARLLLCQQPVDGLNCGHCHGCELSRVGNHGDLKVIQPEPKSRVIKVDQVRALVAFANQRANFGERKVVLLTPAESLNINAANALLKCLEEPSENTYMLLLSHRPNRLPATVRSRCQLYKLPVPDAEQSLNYVLGVTGDRPQSEQLLELANGQPVTAADLYVGDGGAEGVLATQSLLQQVRSGQADPLGAAQELKELSTEQLLSALIIALQQHIRALPPLSLAGTHCRQAFDLLDETTELQRALEAGANPNAQLSADRLLIALATVGR